MAKGVEGLGAKLVKKGTRYGYHQRENTGSRLFTEVKPCWMGLISGWVTISIKYPVLYSLGSQAGVVDISHAFHLYLMLYVDLVSVDLNLTSRVSSLLV